MSYDDRNLCQSAKISEKLAKQANQCNENVKYEYYDNTGEGSQYARSSIKSIAKGSDFKAEYIFGQLWLEEKKTIDSASYQTKYQYDVQGRINKLTYPDGETVNYSYDEGGYLSGISGTQNYMTDIKYNELGQRISLRNGNGIETTYTYTKETGMLDTMKQKLGVNEILNYQYSFDRTGNLTKLADIPNSTTKTIMDYTYDKLGRIESFNGLNNKGDGTQSQNMETYGFDDANRMTFKTFGDGKKYEFHYITNTHAVSDITITGSQNHESAVNFSYDDFGNMTSKIVAMDDGTNKTTNYSYDNSNRMKHIDLPDGMFKLDFKYSNGGQRITKTYSDNCGNNKPERICDRILRYYQRSDKQTYIGWKIYIRKQA